MRKQQELDCSVLIAQWHEEPFLIIIFVRNEPQRTMTHRKVSNARRKKREKKSIKKL